MMMMMKKMMMDDMAYLYNYFFICYASANRGSVKMRYQVMLVRENRL